MIYDFNFVKNNISMRQILERYGFEVDKKGNRPCPIHPCSDNPTGFGIHDRDLKWTCRTHGCGRASSNIDFVMLMEGCSDIEALRLIKQWFNLVDEPFKPREKGKPRSTVVVETAIYDYKDSDGNIAYSMKREKFDDGGKSFKPVLPDGTEKCPVGKRVLYNLDAITDTEDVVIMVEGEKCADAVTSCGFIGTTFGFGCSSWLPQYLDALKGKKVAILADCDESGEKWCKKLCSELAGHVEQLQILRLPDDFIAKFSEKYGHSLDVSDYLNENGREETINMLVCSLMDSEVWPKGIDRSSLNIGTDVCRRIIQSGKLGSLKPVMDLRCIYGSRMPVEVMAGDCMMMIAPTGVGKTRLLSNFPRVFRDLNFAIFDLELGLDTLGIRYIAMENRISFKEAMRRVREGVEVKVPSLDHVFLPKTPSLNTEKIRHYVANIETLTGRWIHVVAIDYIAKMQRTGRATESIEAHASEFKNFCAETNRVGIFTTQCNRDFADKQQDYTMPNKEDAIHTSALEQSAQIVMCYCMELNQRSVLKVKCDKYTHDEMPTGIAYLDANDLVITPRDFAPVRKPVFKSTVD